MMCLVSSVLAITAIIYPATRRAPASKVRGSTILAAVQGHQRVLAGPVVTRVATTAGYW
jgi:hypothetical protein